MTTTTLFAENTVNSSQPSSAQFVTFFVDGLYFGIDVLDVQEVLRRQDITRVPLAPHVIEGLINLRGQIVMAVDMRRRLGLPRRTDSPRSMNIVLKTKEGAVSLLVDEIGDVLEVGSAAFERPPDNLSSLAKELIRGIYKLKDRLLLVIDTDRTVDGGISMTVDPSSGTR